MLKLQNLDLDTHVRLKKNEILEKELQFYNSALNTIATSSAVLAGFAFSGLCMSLEYTESIDDEGAKLWYRTIFVISSTVCVALNLVTLCAATFASLYSVRLALRGGEDSVEKSVKSVRGEYKFVLSLFCLGIFMFFVSISSMGFYKYHPTEAFAMMLIGVVGIMVVGFLMRRARDKFYLSKTQRYLSNKEMKKQFDVSGLSNGELLAHSTSGSQYMGSERSLQQPPQSVRRSVHLPAEEGVPYARAGESNYYRIQQNNQRVTVTDAGRDTSNNTTPNGSERSGEVAGSYETRKLQSKSWVERLGGKLLGNDHSQQQAPNNQSPGRESNLPHAEP